LFILSHLKLFLIKTPFPSSFHFHFRRSETFLTILLRIDARYSFAAIQDLKFIISFKKLFALAVIFHSSNSECFLYLILF